MADKIISLLGLMRRANAISVGETNTGNTVHAGKAKLVLLAGDASDNARRRAEGFITGRNAPIVELPYTKDEISDGLGLAGCSMAAVTDIGFANALMKLLEAADSARYSELAQETARRCEKAEKRKNETKTREKKTSGKRRTIA